MADNTIEKIINFDNPTTGTECNVGTSAINLILFNDLSTIVFSLNKDWYPNVSQT